MLNAHVTQGTHHRRIERAFASPSLVYTIVIGSRPATSPAFSRTVLSGLPAPHLGMDLSAPQRNENIAMSLGML
jgi:hypothetical protein